MGAYYVGYNHATVKAERNALAIRVDTDIRIEKLVDKMRTSDEALLIEQKRTSKVRNVEIIKYVTEYRTKIVNNPVYIECIIDSGLLDIINAANPTKAATD